ncbi:MAG TPA: DUF2721 domain-containing protein [Thermoanaerobaculia bacterium]|nr:DUF2721 domain-containing protein [Thermoanaerobaculia bacterium]
MELSLTTPALLFPAVSLLLLAYTNRFLALASLVRSLHTRYREQPDALILRQIDNLRYRIHLIQAMQATGVSSLLVCVVCMFVLFFGKVVLGKFLFAGSLVLMIASLGLSVREIQVSVKALDLHLHDLEERP